MSWVNEEPFCLTHPRSRPSRFEGRSHGAPRSGRGHGSNLVSAKYTDIEGVPDRRETGSEGNVRDCVEWDNSEEGKAETTKSQEESPWVYLYTFTSFTCGFKIFFLADISYLKIQHLRRSFDHRPVQARPTQTLAFRLLLKTSSTRLFPCSSGTGPSSLCEISALRPPSMRSPQPCSRRMKSALSSLSMRSLLSLARCRTLIPSRH